MAPMDGSGGLASRLFVREANADWVTVNTDTLQTIDDAGGCARAGPGRAPGPARTVANCGYQLGAGPTTIPLDSGPPSPGSGCGSATSARSPAPSGHDRRPDGGHHRPARRPRPPRQGGQ